MNRTRVIQFLTRRVFVVGLLILTPIVFGDTAAAPEEKSVSAPHSQTISVKMIGPVTQTTDLQVICVLKHDPAGDKYIAAMDDFNQKLHGLLSGLRDRGEFSGELGETLLFTPPANTIAPTQVLLVGIGDESGITLERLKLVGEIAAREAVRIKASQVSFVPALRDQGSVRVDVGDGDAAFVTGWILAYDTEKKLQDQQLTASIDVSSLTIQAGPTFFDGAFAKVSDAVASAAEIVNQRSAQPYAQTTAK
jgi:Cytosol aminopeptidase family, N-terminal domain